MKLKMETNNMVKVVFAKRIDVKRNLSRRQLEKMHVFDYPLGMDFLEESSMEEYEYSPQVKTPSSIEFILPKRERNTRRNGRWHC